MNKPVAILSTDATVDYLFLLPIVAESWRLQGFDVLVNMTEFNNEAVIAAMPNNVKVTEANVDIPSKNGALFTQVIRLYMPLVFPDDTLFVLSDVDMFIASDFLMKGYDQNYYINCFGKDLTDYHYPICYVMSTAKAWKEVMGDDGIMSDLENYSNYRGSKEKAWVSDQDIVTKKLLASPYKINEVPRGIDPKNQNLPLGRWDRYGSFKKPSGQIHDVHLMRDPLNHIDKLIEICKTCYPNENWNWIKQYADEFRKQIH